MKSEISQKTATGTKTQPFVFIDLVSKLLWEALGEVT